MPQPAHKIFEVLDFVNALNIKPSAPSEFELALLDQKIRETEDVDIAICQCFRGNWYALKNDLPNTRKWFEMAARSEPSNQDIQINYAAMLFR